MANQPAPSDSENQSLRKINALTADLTADVADGITVNGLTDINAKLPALNSGRIPVDIGSIGTVTVSNEVEVKNDLNSPVPVSDAGGSITVDGPLTDTQLRATAVSVSGTFFQATQPVSGPLTDTELRANPVAVSGTITANAGTNLNTSALALETTATAIKTAVETLDNAIAGSEMQVDIVSSAAIPVTDNGSSLTVDGTVELGATSLAALENIEVTFPSTQNVSVQNASLAVTGTFWQATQPVSGTVTANAGTGAFEVRPRNGSVTVVAGTTDSTPSTSAEALATNSSRQYLYIQNNSDTDMYFNFGAAATTSHLLVKAGVSVAFDSGFVPTNAVNVICGSASKSFYILHA